MTIQKHEIQHVLTCAGPKTSNWLAWIDAMPPEPHRLLVDGEVEVSNVGVLAILRKKVPQGISSGILLLDLVLVQQAGIWPQLTSIAQARYKEILAPRSDRYTEVHIFCGGEIIQQIEVQIIC